MTSLSPYIPYMVALHFFITGDSLVEGKTAEERGQKLLRQASAKEAHCEATYTVYIYQYG